MVVLDVTLSVVNFKYFVTSVSDYKELLPTSWYFSFSVYWQNFNCIALRVTNHYFIYQI